MYVLVHGETAEELAINDVALLRQTAQTAAIRVELDGRERLAELRADGVLVGSIFFL